MRIPFGKCLGSRTGEGHRVCAPHPPLFQIYGLQIPMNDSLFMSGLQRFGNLSCNALNGHRGVPGSRAYCEIFPSANEALEVKVRLSRRGDGKEKAWDIAKRQAERRINLESKDGVMAYPLRLRLQTL